MKFLYQVGITAYAFVAHITAWFNPKAKSFVNGRKNWRKNLAAKINTNVKYIWIHCASLGEFEQGRPLLEKIRLEYPEYNIALTFYSPSGYEIRKNYPHADIISYLPLDTIRNANAFIRILQPEKAFFIKYEYWYNYMHVLKQHNIPLYMVSSIFRENQLFFRNTFMGKWYKKMLFNVSHFFIQDEKSALLLKSIGINNFTISGDTRFDRVAAIAKNSNVIPFVEKFKDQKLLMIAGSTWKPDEELLSRVLIDFPDLKLVVAPHEVSGENMTRLENTFKSIIRLSQLNEKNANKNQILLVDSIGILSSLYRYGDLAFIGGGFGVGIHNILEAATFALPVIFGPNHQKFKEAVDLLTAKGAFTVMNEHDLNRILDFMVNHSEERERAALVCKNYINNNTGATDIILMRAFKQS